MSETTHAKLINEITNKLIDEGTLIEAGFVIFLDKEGLSKERLSYEQIEPLRLAFFCGAQHLFGTITTMLDEGTEPTDADLRKMDSILHELQRFVETLKSRHASPKTSAARE